MRKKVEGTEKHNNLPTTITTGNTQESFSILFFEEKEERERERKGERGKRGVKERMRERHKKKYRN